MSTGVVDYEGESEADLVFWERYRVDTPPELREAIESLRPPRPYWIDPADPQAMERWAVSWRTAALLALAAAPDDPDHELRTFTWHASRTLFTSSIPTDSDAESTPADKLVADARQLCG